jgi:hypothetical protein
MFRRLINDAKSAVSSVILKYVARASVAVPFVIAAGFALAAVTLTLIERFGPIAAYWIMAAGLAAVGLVAALAVSVKEHEEEIAEEKAEQEATAEAATEVAMQAPLALLGALLTSPGGPSSMLGLTRVIGRNLPLVILLIAVAALLWPAGAAERTGAEQESEDEEAAPPPPPRPNGPDLHPVH